MSEPESFQRYGTGSKRFYYGEYTLTSRIAVKWKIYGERYGEPSRIYRKAPVEMDISRPIRIHGSV